MSNQFNHVSTSKKRKSDIEDDEEIDHEFSEYKKNFNFLKGKENYMLGNFLIFKKIKNLESMLSNYLSHSKTLSNSQVINSISLIEYNNLVKETSIKKSKDNNNQVSIIVKKLNSPSNNEVIRSRNGSRLSTVSMKDISISDDSFQEKKHDEIDPLCLNGVEQNSVVEIVPVKNIAVEKKVLKFSGKSKSH